MGRLLAASDIHGHGRLLRLLLDSAGYDPSRDKLFLLGDYVNKGPDSSGTLELIAGLQRAGAVALQGNNERKWLLRPPAEQPQDALAALRYREWIAGLPLWASCGPYLFVHAGIRPGIPLPEQSAEDLTEIREPFLLSAAQPDTLFVFGHTPTFRLGAEPGHIWIGPGKLGIDTGAGHGVSLSLVDLGGGRQWTVAVQQPDIVRQLSF